MSVSYKDYYQLLEVDKKASSADIAKSYKKLARKYHPDLNQGDTKAEEKFKEINEAYEVLKDTEKRKLYDQLGHNWQHGQQFQGAPGFEGFNFNFDGQQFNNNGFSDFFEVLFGQAGRGSRPSGFGPDPFGGFSKRQRRGRDVESEISISLEDALKGGRRNINISAQRNSLEVNIPAGVREGTKLRLSGKGEAAPGGLAGDLFLRIKYLPHPNFGVDGNNITYDLNLNPWEAVLGTSTRVPTLDGEIEMNIPKATSSGRRFRLRGRGLGAEGARGDQMVRVMIKVPESISEEEQKLWEQLAQIASSQTG